MNRALAYLRKFEPARLQALKTSVYGVLMVVGVTVPTDVDGRVTIGLSLLAAILAFWQGETTRKRVTPVEPVGS